MDGAYFAEIGRTYQTENPVHTFRMVPQRVTRPDAAHPFTPKADNLSGLAEQMEDATALHDQWYWTDVAAGQ